MKIKITFKEYYANDVEYVYELLQRSNFHYSCKDYIVNNKRYYMEYLMSSMDESHIDISKSWSLNEFFNIPY